MRAGFILPDWSSLAGLEDDRLPLLATALLIARDEYPQLDADLYAPLGLVPRQVVLERDLKLA